MSDRLRKRLDCFIRNIGDTEESDHDGCADGSCAACCSESIAQQLRQLLRDTPDETRSLGDRCEGPHPRDLTRDIQKFVGELHVLDGQPLGARIVEAFQDYTNPLEQLRGAQIYAIRAELCRKRLQREAALIGGNTPSEEPQRLATGRELLEEAAQHADKFSSEDFDRMLKDLQTPDDP